MICIFYLLVSIWGLYVSISLVVIQCFVICTIRLNKLINNSLPVLQCNRLMTYVQCETMFIFFPSHSSHPQKLVIGTK